jgi:hypothetical protein
MNDLNQYLPTIFQLLLRKLQDSMKVTKTPQFARHFIHTLTVFSKVFGASILYQIIESMTPGLNGNLIQNVWYENRTQFASSSLAERKQVIVGASKILGETPLLDTNPAAWKSLLLFLLSVIMESGQFFDLDFHVEDHEDSREFDGQYSKIAFAQFPTTDPTLDVNISGAAYFVSVFNQIASIKGAAVHGIVESVEGNDQVALQKLLQKGDA